MMPPDTTTGLREPASSPFQAAGSSRTRRRASLLVTLGLMLAAAVAAWRLSRSPDAAPEGGHNHAAAPVADSANPVMLTPEAARRIGVTYAPVDRSSLGRTVRTVAVVTYDETRLKSVTTRVDGWVDQLHVNFTGQAVRTGDPLFSLYSPMLVSAQQELLLARRLQGSVARGTLNAVRGTADLIDAARRRLLYWEVPPDEVRQIEESGTIRKAITFRSPVHGIVLEKSVLAGQRVMAGETVYRIADLSTVWLEGEVFERDLSSVRIGLPVVAEFAALPTTPRSGRISYVYPTIDPETRTVRVRVAMANPGLILKPGMYATFRFSTPTTPVLNVPRSAILSTGKRILVFVRRPDGMLEPRDVALGLATDDRVEILSGLALGDTVVASATFLVDAESNLGSLLGGMGNMPGMDMTAPAPAVPRATSTSPGGATTPPRARPDSMKMRMPDMDGGHAGHGPPEGM